MSEVNQLKVLTESLAQIEEAGESYEEVEQMYNKGIDNLARAIIEMAKDDEDVFDESLESYTATAAEDISDRINILMGH